MTCSPPYRRADERAGAGARRNLPNIPGRGTFEARSPQNRWYHPVCDAAFWLYVGVAALAFIWRLVPEMRGRRALEEIEERQMRALGR